MKVNSIYFSPTGSTKRVVGLLAEAWDGAKNEIDLSVFNQNYNSCLFPKEDLCIVGVPSFGGRVPAPALARLQQMNAQNTQTIIVATFGNRDFDDTLLELEDTLSERGFHVVAAVAAVTEHSIVHRFGKDRPNDDDQRTLRSYAVKIKEALNLEKELPSVQVSGCKPYRNYDGVPFKPKAGKACTQCGVCAALCPVGAIPKKAPCDTDKSLCITCMRCVAVCPVQARALNKAMLFAAGQKMEKGCTEEKSNQLFLANAEAL